MLHSKIKAVKNIVKYQTQAAPLLRKKDYESKMQVGYTCDGTPLQHNYVSGMR